MKKLVLLLLLSACFEKKEVPLVVEVKHVLPAIPKVRLNPSQYTKNLDEYYLGSKKYQALSAQVKMKHNHYFLQELYQNLFTRKVTPEEEQNWMNAFAGGASREGICRGVLLSDVYRDIEQKDIQKLGEKQKIFLKKYFSQYLNLPYKDSSFDNVVILKMKRVLFEKTFETIDALAVKPTDLFAWYAHLANQLLGAYPKSFSGKLRQNSDYEFQYKWAQSVSLDHIKSEVYLSLLKIMNTL